MRFFEKHIPYCFNKVGVATTGGNYATMPSLKAPTVNDFVSIFEYVFVSIFIFGKEKITTEILLRGGSLSLPYGSPLREM